MFWITESRSQLFQRAMPWNPFKILIEFQFDETVKPIKFSAPSFSTTQPFSSSPTWSGKILLQNSRLNLLMTNFYVLPRWQCSPGASLAFVLLYCFPFPTFSIFMGGNQILSQHLLSKFIHAKLCHKLKRQCENSWIKDIKLAGSGINPLRKASYCCNCRHWIYGLLPYNIYKYIICFRLHCCSCFYSLDIHTCSSFAWSSFKLPSETRIITVACKNPD